MTTMEAERASTRGGVPDPKRAIITTTDNLPLVYTQKESM